MRSLRPQPTATRARVLTVDLDRLALAPGRIALDLGCGRGRHAHAIAHRGGAAVIGLDLTRTDLDAARDGFALIDAKGESFRSGTVARLVWKGWRQVTFDASAFPQGFGHWGGDDDGLVSYPIRRIGFGIEEPEHLFFGKGTILLDDLDILTAPPAAH